MSKGWAKSWRKNKWKRYKGGKARNADLWEELLLLCSMHKVSFKWIKGHSGNAENNRCDRLAAMAARAANLSIDHGYEQSRL